MLRRLVLALALAAALAGLALLLTGAVLPGVYLLLSGGVIAAGLLVERGRYRSREGPPGPREESTGERFVDPATGEEVEVRYDPATGRRRYISGGRGPGRRR
ncbi:MAG: hypothetical protein ACREPI_06605 [Candidatus Dormibacterales bacterium]